MHGWKGQLVEKRQYIPAELGRQDEGKHLDCICCLGACVLIWRKEVLQCGAVMSVSEAHIKDSTALPPAALSLQSHLLVFVKTTNIV